MAAQQHDFEIETGGQLAPGQRDRIAAGHDNARPGQITLMKDRRLRVLRAAAVTMAAVVEIEVPIEGFAALARRGSPMDEIRAVRQRAHEYADPPAADQLYIEHRAGRAVVQHRQRASLQHSQRGGDRAFHTAAGYIAGVSVALVDRNLAAESRYRDRK